MANMLQGRTRTFGSFAEFNFKAEEANSVIKDGWLYVTKRRASNRFERRYCVLNRGASFLASLKSPKVNYITLSI